MGEPGQHPAQMAAPQAQNALAASSIVVSHCRDEAFGIVDHASMALPVSR
jgi:hypothetical protein